MSLNEILNSAISGLSASQAGLRSVSNNIANVGTPGYARERVSLSTGVSGGRVSGVIVGEPSRVADKFLENAVYQRGGAAGRSEVASSYLDRLQSLLGAPDSSAGLAARLSTLSSAAAQVTSLQGSSQSVALFTGNVADTIDTIARLQKDVSGLRADVETEVGYTVERANVLLRQIHDLNSEVARLDGLGRSSSGPTDQRVSALEELSGLIDITVREQPDGRVTIDSASGQVLLDKRLRQLSYPSGAGASQNSYPPIDIRFATDSGAIGASTGEQIESAAIGGKLGGLLDMRDRALPQFSEQLGTLFSGLAQSLNAVSNAGTTLPPPNSLTGEANGLVGADRLGFTGKAVFAVAAADGTLVQKVTVDFDALGAGATVDDAVAAINTGLSPAATASFVDGVLSIQATDSSQGIAIAQDPDAPSDRAGVGFSQFFGLNNLVRSDASALVPSGFTPTDPHGFGAGETTEIALRDSTGKLLASYTLTGSAGPTFGDLMTELNASPLGQHGSFALDDKGRVQFTPDSLSAGSTISIPSDSTSRYGTGLSFSALSGLSGAASGLASAEVRADIAAKATLLPLARLQLDVPVNSKAIGAGDLSGATAFIDELARTFDFGKDGSATIETFASRLLGGAGTEASLAQTSYAGAAARLDDAVNRRDSYAGVNVDEELAQMVVLQNSYSASARVMTTASEMYDTLLQMLR
ncbi:MULTISPECIES: flagellar hook-associated protein FlgK [unclassified Sphingobium]|uniref:flagellar hook-associated protein FlgK n=1 Tax=unclassified Sphingobium TaxID=2611147 RepID=UPI0007F32F49|nr:MULTISPECIES: flagellar hook-associated protein FlgK [unclassified Sphingobium]OAN52596.1 flagellar hook-associated protein FlgK [Sphingobium sp. TCM1]WIW90917.1 flagellar hook-associated protein FlgK [Sphingobium sp. V4]